MNNHRICTRCVSDETMTDITFDNEGVCCFCKLHDRFMEIYPLGKAGENKLNDLMTRIKNEGENKKYDCIIGLSGGADSTFLLYWAVQSGLRPLSITFDNGWNSEIAIANIKKATHKLGVDLRTIKADYKEMADLQRAFIIASVSDADAPSDYAIYSILYSEAIKESIRYCLNGHSFRAEGSVPKSWSYFDSRYIRSIHKLFGQREINKFPLMSIMQFVYYSLVKGIRDIRIFDYLDYKKQQARTIIKNELDWCDYGGHHHENKLTKFFQSYYLPVKFNIDKRKVEYSALIRSGQMLRQSALEELKTPYRYEEKDIEYAIEKLGFSQTEWLGIMSAPRKWFYEYPTYYKTIKAMKYPMKIAAGMNLIPQILYEKYALMQLKNNSNI
ncbi:MAG: N-acetyl sugar amidotransferase [Methanococcaceae archaeon]